MTHTSTEQERAEFEAWVEEYGLSAEPNYNQHTRADCWAAWQASRRAQVAGVFAPAAQADTKDAAPAQEGWCDGCNPDNCVGCGPAAPAQAQPEPKRESSHDL